jgi:hypothetical protein
VAANADLVHKKLGQKVSATTLLYVLKCRIYYGEIEWHDRTYVGSHTPLVSRDRFEKVQAMLNGNSMGEERNTCGTTLAPGSSPLPSSTA